MQGLSQFFNAFRMAAVFFSGGQGARAVTALLMEVTLPTLRVCVPVGTVNVRKPGDYVAEMIRMAGGQYVPQDLEDNGNALSTMNMDMESFYAAAKDADILVYNSTIDGELERIEQLLQKSSLLADFKAVQNGDVWCTGQNMFQESMGLGNMILELHTILADLDPQGLTYLHRLQ